MSNQEGNTVDQAVELLLDMGEVVLAAGNDCDQMAAEVGRWIDTNGDKRKKINAELERTKTAKTEEAYRRRMSEHLELIQAMMAGVEGCSKHAGFMRAWNRLDD